MTTKKKLKNSEKKRKFVNSSTNTTGFISKDVREIYRSFRYKPAENCEYKKAVQVAKGCYQSHIDNNFKEGLDEPTKKNSFFNLVMDVNPSL